MAYKKWIIRSADKEKASELSEKFNMDPFIAYLLVSRGLSDALSVGTFLGDSYVFTSPFNFADMEEATFTIGDAVDAGERICIYGDYDCDGVTSTALLLSFLKSEGADVFYYIPSREGEGYGLNKEAIDYIKEQGADLIVTVDNGISAIDEAEYIYSLGMRLVVTDHHQLADTLPRAEAVVNPHREDNDLEFHDYCGVGVAFKLICAMYECDVNDLVDEYIDLVAIGTIADVVPLIDENRAFVKAGLDKINNNPRPAIEAFKLSNSYDRNKQYTSNEIAFQLCPRINAMGRMDDASKAVEFLVDTDFESCKFRASQLDTENAHRQEVERSILSDVERQIEKNPELVVGRVIVIAGEGYHHGVIGIVASHILERYGKPAIIIGIDENGVARGSARSVEGFNIYEAIASCEKDLIRFGGHPLAAGITLESKNIDIFREHINNYALQKYDLMPPQSFTLDCKLSPDYLTLNLVNSLAALEPYGAANPQPVFGVYNVKLVGVTPLSEGRHIRLELEKKGKRFRAVKFSTSPEEFPYKTGDIINLALKLSKSFFKEKYYLSVQALDVHLASFDEDKYFKEKNDFELYTLCGRVSADLYPSRDDCAAVYRFIKDNGGFAYSVDELYCRLQNKVSYGKLVFALKAFLQAGLLTINERITLLEPSRKVRLEDTEILTELRERLNIG